KYRQRQRLFDEVRTARITVAEVRNMLDAGQAPLIFALRSSAAVEEDPALIQGAIHLSMDDGEKRLSKGSKDRENIVYCSCPNDVSRARLALCLQRQGFARVRSLLGGIDDWREQNYPTETTTSTLTGTPGAGLGNQEAAHLNAAKSAFPNPQKEKRDED